MPALEEPLVIHTRLSAAERRRQVRETLAAVGLREEHAGLFPHEFSGGQQRRVGLARILTLRPELVILDEPTSGLDVSVQATILTLLRDLRRQYDLTMLFISHDLSVVRMMCDRVAVMYLGRIVEVAPTAELFAAPRHPYTQALLAAVPRPGERHVIDAPLLEGDPPDPSAMPTGCRFRGRCPNAADVCARDEPPFVPAEAGHHAACHFTPI
jgi:oligopeptide/dipeptide ABC transporter ATP-binding protein